MAAGDRVRASGASGGIDAAESTIGIESTPLTASRLEVASSQNHHNFISNKNAFVIG